MFKKIIAFAIFSLLLVIDLRADVNVDKGWVLKAVHSYGSSDIWKDTTLAKWVANRNHFMFGTNGTAGVPYVNIMKAIRPNIKVAKYELQYLPLADTLKVKQWCLSKGYDFETFILRVKPGMTVTVRTDASKTTGFGRFVTTPGGEILRYPGFTDAQTRFAWDFRNPKVGEYLGETMAANISAVGGTHSMTDEEGQIGATNNANAGMYPAMPTFREIDTVYWKTGSPYTSLTRPWGNNFDLEDADNTHSYNDVKDSLRRARAGWEPELQKTLAKFGYGEVSNWAAIPTGTWANWANEGKFSARRRKGYTIGEYSYFYPGNNGSGPNIDNLIKACDDVKDDGIDLVVGWIRMGQYDLGQGISYDRSKMNGLGLMLSCIYPGTTNYYFMPTVKNGEVNFFMKRNLNGFTADDTLTMWDDSWTKYFGYPTNPRPTTSGTDPAGQPYKYYTVKYMNPVNQAMVQTLVLFRYTNGTNFNVTQTAVKVPLGGSYYQLLPGGKYSGPVDSTTIGNAESKIFIKDTLLANVGPNPNVPLAINTSDSVLTITSVMGSGAYSSSTVSVSEIQNRGVLVKFTSSNPSVKASVDSGLTPIGLQSSLLNPPATTTPGITDMGTISVIMNGSVVKTIKVKLNLTAPTVIPDPVSVKVTNMTFTTHPMDTSIFASKLSTDFSVVTPSETWPSKVVYTLYVNGELMKSGEQAYAPSTEVKFNATVDVKYVSSFKLDVWLDCGSLGLSKVITNAQTFAPLPGNGKIFKFILKTSDFDFTDSLGNYKLEGLLELE